LLITQSSWLLTLSPNCQITIPKSFQTHTFAFRRGNLHSYLPSLFREHKGTKFFALSSPPSIFHRTSGQRGQRYEVFDIHKYPLAPPPPCHPSKIMPNLTISPTPPLSALPPASPLFRERKGTKFFALSSPLYFPPHISTGSAKVRSFSLCQVLSPYTPSLLPSLRGATKLRTFWHLKASLLSKTHSPLKRSAKVRCFSLCQAPPSIPPRFFLGSAKVRRF
jgi:hypothetical protein